MMGHTNATVFTEDRGTQENKMCCLIYFYFITVASLMGTENECMQTKTMSTTSKTITTETLIKYGLTDRPYTRNRPYTYVFSVIR